MYVHTCGGGHRSALALQSICASITQEECMAVKCRYIFTYAATEYSQARKCTYKHWRMIRRCILDSSQTHNLTEGVLHFVVHNCLYITELLGSVTTLDWKKNSSLYSYVDFVSVIFISHTRPQNFNILKYFVVCDLKTIFCTQFIGIFIIHLYTKYLIFPDISNKY